MADCPRPANYVGLGFSSIHQTTSEQLSSRECTVRLDGKVNSRESPVWFRQARMCQSHGEEEGKSPHCAKQDTRCWACPFGPGCTSESTISCFSYRWPSGVDPKDRQFVWERGIGFVNPTIWSRGRTHPRCNQVGMMRTMLFERESIVSLYDTR